MAIVPSDPMMRISVSFQFIILSPVAHNVHNMCAYRLQRNVACMNLYKAKTNMIGQ